MCHFIVFCWSYDVRSSVSVATASDYILFIQFFFSSRKLIFTINKAIYKSFIKANMILESGKSDPICMHVLDGAHCPQQHRRSFHNADSQQQTLNTACTALFILRQIMDFSDKDMFLRALKPSPAHLKIYTRLAHKVSSSPNSIQEENK